LEGEVMRRGVVLILGLVVLHMVGSAYGSSQDNNSLLKDIWVEVSGEIEGKSIIVHVTEGGERRKIMEFKGVTPQKKSDVIRARVPVHSDVVELEFIIDRFEYVFDVKVQQGWTYLLYKADDRVDFGHRKEDEISTQGAVKSYGEPCEATIRFLGVIVRENMEVYVDSRRIFASDDNLIIPRCDIKVPIKSRIFNVIVVVDGFKRSYDFDSLQGCFIGFHFTEHQTFSTQYLNEDSLPLQM
jgi:hypothetical protein